MQKKNIVLYGIECVDLCLYLSRILKVLGKETAVVDHSNSKIFAACIPGFEESDYTDYRGVHFYKDKEESSLQESYDAIISYCGFNELMEKLGEDGDIYYIVDQIPYHVNTIKKMVSKIDRPVSFVYKDYVECKISDKALDLILNVPEDKVKYSYVIPFDYDDFEMNLIAQYNSVFHFEKLSSDFRRFILDMVCEFCGEQMKEKDIAKLMKKAEKGA